MLQNNLSNNLIADVTSFEHILSNCDSKENIEKLFMEFMQHTSRNRDEQDVYNIARYVNILPKSFYGLGSYSNWIKTCWALKHASIEFGNPYKLFIVWLYFSSKSDSFDVTNGVQECLEKWNSANVLLMEIDIGESLECLSITGLRNTLMMNTKTYYQPTLIIILKKHLLLLMEKEIVVLQMLCTNGLSTSLFAPIRKQIIGMFMKVILGKKMMEVMKFVPKLILT